MSIKSHIQYINIKKMMQKSKLTLKKLCLIPTDSLFSLGGKEGRREEGEKERRRWAEREKFFFVRKGCVLYCISTPIHPKSSH